jgi:hypothetical protein
VSAALEVGEARQLLFDDRFVAASRGLRREMGAAVPRAEPVLVPDRPWEAREVGKYNTVLREADGRFRMWYGAMLLGGSPKEGAGRLAYAESRDGLRWEKPSLGLVEFRGSRENNLVAPALERQSLQGACVYRDARAPAAERYKLLTKFRASDAELAAGARNGLYAMHSPDGLRWSVYPGQPCSPVMCDTQNMFFWDDRLGRYAAYTRVKETQKLDEAALAAGRRGFRAIGRVTSPDFREWSAQELVLQADDEDLRAPLPEGAGDGRPQVDFYTSCAMKYEGAQDAYLMFPSVFHHWGEGDFPATMDVQLLTSRDGARWERQGGRAPFLRRGPDGSDRSGMVFANPWLLPAGDELWLYFAGTDRRHVPGDAPCRSGIYRASLRRDGFAGLAAGLGGGEFTTPPLRFRGSRLALNFEGSSGGWGQVEVLDAEGGAIPGFRMADGDPLTGDSVDLGVAWRGKGDLSALAGRAVRLRVALRSARLWAFQFEPRGGAGG